MLIYTLSSNVPLLDSLGFKLCTDEPHTDKQYVCVNPTIKEYGRSIFKESSKSFQHRLYTTEAELLLKLMEVTSEDSSNH